MDKPREFFSSKIYYDTLKDTEWPTFSFLSTKKGYGLSTIKRLVQKKQIKYLFIIINGQQIPTLDSNPERDKLFGEQLTGIHRIIEKNIWLGKCKVYTNASKFPNTAAMLFDLYKDDCLILNILNPKYEWQNFSVENIKAVDNIMFMLQGIFQEIMQARRQLPDAFIAGYSRGGIFAIRLVEQLKGWVKIRGLVTLDPVISELAEADSLCAGWSVKKGKKWKIIWKEKIPGIHLSGDSFPIVRNPGVVCYNVFQRKSFLAFNHILEKPIGSAVDGATAPFPRKKWGIKPVASESPYDQYDTTLETHSGVIGKYHHWIISIAKRICP
ncbi:hypothetical protein K8S19_11650 [bacterium]|nr:hypothetical protein [bacterium]